MAAITYHDVKCLQTDPVLQEVVKCSEKNLPELNLIPQVAGPGDAYEFWKRTKRIDQPIFVKDCEGVCAAQAGWEKERRELRLVRRKLEACDGALQANSNGTQQPLDVWDETRMEELAGIRRRLVRGLYESEGPSAAYTLDDFACIKVNALAAEWNGTQDLVADPDAPTAGEEAALGGFTSAYLVNASERGLHWRWGNNRMLSFGQEEFKEIRDEKKSLATGEDCTYPGIVQFVDGRVAPVAKCEFDVVKIVNIPCALGVDKFYLDNILDQVIPLVYENSLVQPNLLLAPSVVIANWWTQRKTQAIDNGGCCFMEIPGAPADLKIPYLNQYGLAVGASSCIPSGPFEKGTVTRKAVFNELGDLNLTS